FDGTAFIPFVETNDPSTILGGLVNALHLDHLGRIWVGSWTRGLSMIDPASFAVQRFTRISPDTMPQTITCIFQDTSNTLYVGLANHGLIILDLITNEFTQHFTFRDSLLLAEFDHTQNNYRNAVKDRDDPTIIWIPSLHGLVEFHPADTSAIYHYYSSGQVYPTYNDRLRESMRFIHQSADGKLWISTWSEDLLEFDKSTGTFTAYPCTLAGGRCGPLIGSISLSADTILVAARTRGIVVFDRQSGTFTLLNALPEYAHMPRRPYSFFRDRASNIWISTEDAGFYILPPVQDPSMPLQMPEPRITAFQVFDDTLDVFTDSLASGRVTLRHDQNFFSVQYSAFDPEFRSAKEFSYQMEGVHHDWVMAGGRRYVSFTNLDGGNYTFHLRVRRQGETWSDHVLSFDIRIIPPFWERAWFWPLIILVVVGMLLLFYRSRINRIKSKAALQASFEKQLAEVEMQALRAQMNPHFLFNSLNSIKYYVVEESPVKAAGYIDRFARLIRLVLQNSRQKLIPLSSELEALELYIQVEQLRFEHAFSYEIRVQEGLDAHYYQIPPLLL
ncbi:MAG: histidine kinase, partial [Saprospiraceae bacterium]|nr:histidine kinase [Saprospiraceae bacterium]